MTIDLTTSGQKRFTPGDNVTLIYPGNVSKTFSCVSIPNGSCKICDINDGAQFCPIKSLCSPGHIFLVPDKKAFSLRGRNS